MNRHLDWPHKIFILKEPLAMLYVSRNARKERDEGRESPARLLADRAITLQTGKLCNLKRAAFFAQLRHFELAY